MTAVAFDYSADRLAQRVAAAERDAALAHEAARSAREDTQRMVREHCRELQALNDLWQHYDAEQRQWRKAG